MIPELASIRVQLATFERGLEEFMTKAEQVKSDNIALAKENQSLKERILELEVKIKEHNAGD